MGFLIDVEAAVVGGLANMPLGMESRGGTQPYGLYMVAHGYASRPFTPPYPKGGAYGGA
jgi:hypothetical protein